MSYEYLAVETKDRIRTIRLSREEKRNALSMKMRDEIEACLRQTDEDPEVTVAVLTGGRQAFSAGFDLQEVVATRFKTFDYRAQEFNRALYGFSKPLVAAVSGPAMAGGFDLALAADFIVASETARFGHPEVNFGAALALAVLWTRVGLAKELAMSGNTIDAAEAYRVGLVNRVVPVDQLMDAAMEMAKALVTKPPAALRAVKQTACQIASLELFAGMRLETESGSEALRDPENLRRAEAYFASLRGRS